MMDQSFPDKKLEPSMGKNININAKVVNTESTLMLKSSTIHVASPSVSVRPGRGGRL